MKAPPILEENSRKIEIKLFPLCAIPHENQSSRKNLYKKLLLKIPRARNCRRKSSIAAGNWDLILIIL